MSEAGDGANVGLPGNQIELDVIVLVAPSSQTQSLKFKNFARFRT